MAKRICVFDGQDAAPEAMDPTVELLNQLGVDIEIERPTVNERADEFAEGQIPPVIEQSIEDADTVLFGAARADGDTYVHILTYLRTQYGGGLPANVRPSRYLDGVRSPLADPQGIDYVVVRENPPSPFSRTENMEGDLSDLAEATANFESENVLGENFEKLGDGAFSVKVLSERHTQKLASVAMTFAKEWFDHRPITVTSATKSSSLSRIHGLFDSIVKEETAKHDTIEFEQLQVDTVGSLLVTDPQRFDIIVTPNAEGDILSDLGAATIGGLGLAPSGCYGENTAYFEPIHGTAPDIAGEEIINPTATILSAVMMLRYLGFEDAATTLEGAVESVYVAGEPVTPDQGGSASTTEMVDAIVDNLD